MVVRFLKSGLSESEALVSSQTGDVEGWQNPVRISLQEAKPVVGMTLSTPSVEIAAQVADMGFDFLWIEMEHSPITLESAET